MTDILGGLYNWITGKPNSTLQDVIDQGRRGVEKVYAQPVPDPFAAVGLPRDKKYGPLTVGEALPIATTMLGGYKILTSLPQLVGPVYANLIKTNAVKVATALPRGIWASPQGRSLVGTGIGLGLVGISGKTTLTPSIIATGTATAIGGPYAGTVTYLGSQGGNVKSAVESIGYFTEGTASNTKELLEARKLAIEQGVTEKISSVRADYEKQLADYNKNYVEPLQGKLTSAQGSVTNLQNQYETEVRHAREGWNSLPYSDWMQSFGARMQSDIQGAQANVQLLQNQLATLQSGTPLPPVISELAIRQGIEASMPSPSTSTSLASKIVKHFKKKPKKKSKKRR